MATADLTKLDRCDLCGAQGYVVVLMPVTNKPLLFCNHHFSAYEGALDEQGATILQDNRAQLKEKAHV